jgi:AcrR family transcriptional regulator
MEKIDFKSLVFEKAKEIFKLYGYKKTTMDDIAKACHKSKGLLYHHFSSKEEIFKLILNDELNALFSDLKMKINMQISMKDKFVIFCKISNEWLNDKANIYNKIIREIFDYIDVIKDEIENFHSKMIDMLKMILTEGVNKNCFTVDNYELTALSILQMIIGIMYLPLKQIFNLNVNNKIDINKFVDIIYYGLAKR